MLCSRRSISYMWKIEGDLQEVLMSHISKRRLSSFGLSQVAHFGYGDPMSKKWLESFHCVLVCPYILNGQWWISFPMKERKAERKNKRKMGRKIKKIWQIALRKHRQIHGIVCSIFNTTNTQNYPNLLITLRSKLESFHCFKKSISFLCADSSSSTYVYNV